MAGNNQRDVVIIGGGHNGLVTAFYLAKAGFKPLVLERSAQVGGAAITDEFHPGFRCSTLAHTAGPIRPDIVRDMELEKHGLISVTPDICVTALSPEGRALSLYQDADRSAQEIAAFSQKDGAKYVEFQQSLGKISKVIGDALATTPPNIDDPSRGDLWGMLKTGRAIRKLGKKDMFRLAAMGTHGRRGPGLGILRNGIAASRHRRARNLRNVPRSMVGWKCVGSADSRCRRSLPCRFRLSRRRRHGCADSGDGFCCEGGRSGNSHRRRSHRDPRPKTESRRVSSSPAAKRFARKRSSRMPIPSARCLS